MKTSVFEHQHYKPYLLALTKTQTDMKRGIKSHLARLANIQLAYLTRVLQGEADLSLEQGFALSRGLGHTENERSFFLLLIERDRAGTQELRDHFTKRIDEINEKRLVLKERFNVKSRISETDQATYYSQWIYAAFHVLVSIPTYQTRESIAKHLGLSADAVAQVAEFLISAGLVEMEGDQFRTGVTRLHLGSESKWIAKHHINWRLQSMKSLDNFRENKDKNLHYTSVVSLAKEDAKKIKKVLVDMMEEFNSVVKDSPEQEMHCLCVDFFET